ncbi:MAG: hypothetical protein O4861_01485 [Trichodesmium sp. St16_bin4-tuft]|nr:hypothetical protein [Trichodesmium sp. MAG_R01]MDE5073054.1 hypothetical protein [Trichodesmium sp. St5_bin8]MDE5077206.1 hypothetical protein [Trichodesmium sp. St2_bin6]MDE5090837.1 hypothetical protein [Trichodesmium sp. St18_bin3_1_1]MDE5097079.1 hypothetical protein [Trichodesmium sp. St16_bin4-tuft]MDE5103997.1 hypothetical protein [Trichodesmium sp. St19_bin2]
MPSFRENSSENPTITTPSWKISSELVLSLATGPVLLGLLGNKAINELLLEIGLYSEEIFRGDRLPILKFPQKNPLDL